MEDKTTTQKNKTKKNETQTFTTRLSDNFFFSFPPPFSKQFIFYITLQFLLFSYYFEPQYLAHPKTHFQHFADQ